ncbi:MAG TPA: SAM-dependent methyltransferase [Blastocatellia bacterium]|nr:SAM-dependent methyltransferase [Blastocatellia bacterium]
MVSTPNPLETKLLGRIHESGPISFRDFMEAALYHQEFGYYNTTRPKIGREGDFLTSSSVHAVFGQVMASSLRELLNQIDNNASGPFNLCETGAGTGQLAFDVISTFATEWPQIFERLRYFIVETSPAMKALQKQKLHAYDATVQWIKFEDIAEFSGIVFSNEFIDALPVHRVRLRDQRLQEQFVVGSQDPALTAPRLAPVWSENVGVRVPEYISRMGVPLREGQIVEVGLEGVDWLSRIGAGFKRGFVMTVDYGDLAPLLWSADRHAGTLRSFKSHRLTNSVFDSPGEQDLTASVNFTGLIEYGRQAELETVSYEHQTAFLIRHGLLERVAALEDTNSRLAAKNLLVPGGAGHNFRVLVQRRSVMP